MDLREVVLDDREGGKQNLKKVELGLNRINGIGV